MKKTLLILVIGIIAASRCFANDVKDCWDGTVAETYDGGDGTQENPYQIANAEQLALLAQQTNNGIGANAYYILIDDICLNEEGGRQNWTPIGMPNAFFGGHFDGNGKTISGLCHVQDETTSDPIVGLFGCTDGAEIKNVRLNMCEINSDAEYVGALVGYAGRSNISDCSLEDSYIFSGEGVVGGLIGYMGTPYGAISDDPDTCYLDGCFISASVVVEGARTGGIVAQCNSYITPNVPYVVKNCVNEGTVLGRGETGGIGGWLFFTNVMGCTNHGSITGGSTGGIAGGLSYFTSFRDCINDGSVSGGNISGGVIGTTHHGPQTIDVESLIRDCHNYGEVSGSGTNENSCGGGILGRLMNNNDCVVVDCSNHGNVIIDGSRAGGLVGRVHWSSWPIVLMNVYNVGRVSAHEYVGGIWGFNDKDKSSVFNVWNTGVVVGDESAKKGTLFGWCQQSNLLYDCYWLADDSLGAVGQGSTPQHSCAFNLTDLPTEWQLDSLQYGSHDLLGALNAGAEAIEASYPEVGSVSRWCEDVDLVNGGFPVFGECAPADYSLMGTEWYYEIVNENGNVTYQHLEYLADTTVGNEKPKIIVRTNQIYDKESQVEVTYEYIFERDNKVYWWNNESQQYTVLYDFAAQVGDSWEIEVGSQSLIMQVDAVGSYDYDGNTYRMLRVSDEENLFSGNIVCGIGHLTSFFPEILMSNEKGYRVEGLRCCWDASELVFKLGDKDCEEVYERYHNGVDETIVETGFSVYPNPTTGLLHVIPNTVIPSIPKSRNPEIPNNETSTTSLATYRITNLLGQTLLTGILTASPLDVSSLSNGIYFLKIDNFSIKFIVNQ